MGVTARAAVQLPEAPASVRRSARFLGQSRRRAARHSRFRRDLNERRPPSSRIERRETGPPFSKLTAIGIEAPQSQSAAMPVSGPGTCQRGR